MNYSEYFRVATGNPPFPFQKRFREETDLSSVLKAPTGLGKTDTVLIAWLHARSTRRLVWCLPGRALTEQVARVAEERIERLVEAELLGRKVRVLRLLGGSADNEERLRPDEDAVLVGTQDLLLSRALNRGYARSPFRWPMDFALLNNDCYWMMDEVQLLGDGLATSLQLAAFRERFGVFGTAPVCWSSATIDPAWMETVDFAGGMVKVIVPDEEDRKNPMVAARLGAEKRLERAPEACRFPAGIAEFVGTEHEAGTLTLVIANTVRRAVEIRTELEKKETGAEVRLLHSRFRAAERKRNVDAAVSAVPDAGRIVVATQVIEAGIDVDAALMVTDIAPYASMVQRFGRVNRRGTGAGRIYWVDQPLSAKQKIKESEKAWVPYEADEVKQSLEVLRGLNSAAPDDLPSLTGAPLPWKHVLRRADLLDLFDTSSDLGGNQIDISRFVRSDEDRDVYVAWREWADEEKAPPADLEIDDSELCPVSIGEANKKEVRQAAWSWNGLAGEWERPDTVYPGMRLLLHCSEGRYTEELGWAPESKVRVKPVPAAEKPIEKADQDRRSFIGRPQSLDEHTRWVCEAMDVLLSELAGLGVEEYGADLQCAARLHDWGKSHPVMQKTLHGTDGPWPELLAKSDRLRTHDRRYFRHELASALAMLESGESDLAAYLAAAHHGKIRVVIRSMPNERFDGRVRVRGIENDDLLPDFTLGGKTLARIKLTLDSARLGHAEDGSSSWTDRVLGLRDRLGPFRLAYLEMLLRAADEIASARAEVTA
jgi:CRISPR-associated endonuclease/helicase Cas3